jgi:hypothetical protein
VLLHLSAPPHSTAPHAPPLQVYPKTFIGDASMYAQGWWKQLVKAWEVVIFNPLVDMQRCDGMNKWATNKRGRAALPCST